MLLAKHLISLVPLIQNVTKISAALALIIGVNLQAHASFDKAMEFYQQKDFTRAKLAFEAMGAIGDNGSLFNLGVMYYRGEATERDPVMAFALFKIVADNSGDENVIDLRDKLYNHFDDQQKQAAEKTYQDLAQLYSQEAVKHNLTPDLVSDAESAPDPEILKQQPPKYPKAQLENGTMGYTILEMTISPEGYPRDIYAVESLDHSFSKASMKAASEFLYQPPESGDPINNHKLIFTYKIADAEVINIKRVQKFLDSLLVKADAGDAMAQYQYAKSLNVYKRFDGYLDDVNLEYQEANKWLAEAANQGLAYAQYDLGRNMVFGKGCKVDKENGEKWISAAAVSGYSPAQSMLAISLLDAPSTQISTQAAGMSWLRAAAKSGDDYPRVLLAWELAASENDLHINGEEALALLKKSPKTYYDEIRVLETKAAAYAQTGDFKNAIKHQEKAKKKADKKNWNIAKIDERMSIYLAGKTYRGSYY